MTTLLGIVMLATIGILVFLQTAIFGKTPTGADLERVQKSPHYRNGKFENQRFTPDLAEGATYWKIIKEQFRKIKDKEPDQPIPSVKTDLNNLNSDAPQVVWFGHSSYLLRINGKNILVDPVFSGYASPIPIFGKAYDATYNYTVADMPDVIDVLLISHDHYDHLDYKTVKALQPRVKQVVTSLGVGSHLRHWGYDKTKITELDWNDSTTIDSVLNFTAQPARHFSGRGLKRNQTFWSSFVLKTSTHRLFLGGDSGYDTHFKEIGEKHGPFDLAVLECGQYNPYWKYIHTMPEETTQAAIDLKAKLLLPVHWGKFTLAPHAWHEPIERVTKKAAELNLPILTPMIGQQSPLTPDGGTNLKKWWRL